MADLDSEIDVNKVKPHRLNNTPRLILTDVAAFLDFFYGLVVCVFTSLSRFLFYI